MPVLNVVVVRRVQVLKTCWPLVDVQFNDGEDDLPRSKAFVSASTRLLFLKCSWALGQMEMNLQQFDHSKVIISNYDSLLQEELRPEYEEALQEKKAKMKAQSKKKVACCVRVRVCVCTRVCVPLRRRLEL